MEKVQNHYYWNEKTIDARIKEMRRRLDLTTDRWEEIQLRDILTDLEEVKTVFEGEEFFVADMEEVIMEHVDVINSHEEVGTVLSSFHGRFDEYEKVKGAAPIFIKCTRDGVIEFASEFFENLDERFSKPFEEIKKRIGSNHLFFDSDSNFATNGFMFPIRHLPEAYTASLKDGTVDDVLRFIHEMGHAVEFVISGEDYATKANFAFSEVAPIFMELLAIDSAIAKYKIKNGWQKLHLAQVKLYYENMIGAHFGWKANSLAVTCLGKSEKKIAEIVGRQMHVSYIKAERLIASIDFDEDIKYSIGYAVAIELYMIYRKCPKDALDILYSFIAYDTKSSDEILRTLNYADCYPGTRLEEYKLLLK